MNGQLKQEFEFYLDHQDELLKQYAGRYVVIKDCKVLGAYDSQLKAISETEKAHPLGTFLIQLVQPGTAAYRQTFHSRVATH